MSQPYTVGNVVQGLFQMNKKTNSLAFSPRANYTD
jgi:hypothetical protein